MRKYLTLREASELLPSKPAVATVWRWARRGVEVPEINTLVRLQYAWIGRRVFTTAEWLDDFIDRMTAARTAQEMCRAGGRDGRKWREFIRLAEADIVLRRARI